MSDNQSALDASVRQQLTEAYRKLTAEGGLSSRDQLAGYYRRFRDEFGPDALSRLDGPALLEKMHDHSNRGSLVYWLEYKNDEELPAIFGSIAGGSALKFRIFRRKETGAWVVGSATQQREIPVDEAVAVARTHRGQLLAGAALLEKLPENATDDQYAQLQTAMNQEARDVSDLAWGHKYFHMLFPTKLDDYHSLDYQVFHLVKLLQVPPLTPGRYASAGRYVAVARELDMPMSHLSTLLNRVHGDPYRYWRIGSSPEGINRWREMREGGFVAIGWSKLGDLTGLAHDIAARNRLRTMIQERYPTAPQVVGNAAQQVLTFCVGIAEGELVAVATGETIHGIGRVAGSYHFEPGADGYHHQRRVQWLNAGEWRLPVREGLRMTVYQVRKHPENMVAIEQKILGPPLIAAKPTKGDSEWVLRLEGVLRQIQRVLDRKGQTILYGPPGTGKTYWAEKAARDLSAYSAFGQSFAQLSSTEQAEVIGHDADTSGLVRMCCFHPAYGYEDFLEGYRPETQNDRLTFVLRDGIFKALCAEAERQPSRDFYLIIDEINRGDIPRIFGELLTILEFSKRGKPIILPLSRTAFRIPRNVFVIGTMNTADRSIALLDTALRRRFGFVELMPDPAILGDTILRGVPLGPWLASLNRRICEHIGRDARNLQVGHSYLMDGETPIADFGLFKRALREDILPLLEEYCYDDYETLERILGKGLVDAASHRYAYDLFEAGRESDLVQALLSPDPDIGEAATAIGATEEPSADEAGAENSLETDEAQ